MSRCSCLGILIGIYLTPSLLSGQAIDEYQLKGIWIGKFTHFVNWPASTDSSEYFTIATYIDDPFNGKLDTIYQNQTIWDKPVRIVHFKKMPDLSNIQILFISPQKKEMINEMIIKAYDKKTLLISDTKGYGKLGTHINFFIEDNRVKFEINESSMRSSGFFVSYRLLNIARIIEPITTSAQ